MGNRQPRYYNNGYYGYSGYNGYGYGDYNNYSGRFYHRRPFKNGYSSYNDWSTVGGN